MEALVFKLDGFTRVIFYRHISRMGYTSGSLIIKTDDGLTWNIEGQHNIDALLDMMLRVIPEIVGQLRGEPATPAIILKFGQAQNKT